MQSTHEPDGEPAIFGRLNKDGNVVLLETLTGEVVTRLDADLYPVGSTLSTRYEHPQGIVLSQDDANRHGICVEGW